MISIKMPASGKYIRSLRLFASGLGLDLNFDIEKIEDLKVLISESVNYKLGEGEIKIDFILDDELIDVRVYGEDKSLDEKAITMRDAILSALADELNIEDGLIEFKLSLFS